MGAVSGVTGGIMDDSINIDGTQFDFRNCSQTMIGKLLEN